MFFNGVLVASVTFFKENGDLDLVAFENHLQYLMSQEVHGIVPCGTTGEGATLNDGERQKLISATIGIFKSRGKVLVGCGTPSTDQTLHQLKQAHELGADGVLVVTPYYNRPTQAGILAHYEYLASNSSLPIVLYHIPSRTNVAMTLETIERLLGHPNIVGIKESTPTLSSWFDLTELCSLRNKSFLTGDDGAFSTQLTLGANGIISAAANLIPGVFVTLFRLGLQKNWECFELQRKYHRLIQALYLETNPAPLKRALELTRHIRCILRLPLVPISSTTEQILKQCLQESL